MIRFLCVMVLALLTACSEPKTGSAPKADVTTEGWYAETVTRLQEGNRQAEEALRRGDRDGAGKLIVENEKAGQRLLEAPHPTLAATLAVSDTDNLHARMLLTNKHYGWARLILQKDAARWQHWTPSSEESQRRLAAAQKGMAEVDGKMVSGR
ncbi:MAG: hypothetical protein ABI693_15850 [Bryobacteraceae bacterium]